MAEDERPDLKWGNQIEDIIAGEAEQCRGLAWIHQRAERVQSWRSHLISVPVIVLSTLTGTASIGSSAFFGDSTYASMGIGLTSILVGILQTIESKFQFSRKSEAHRIAFLQYSKLFAWVRVELGLPRKERMEPQILLQELRDEMTRLAETTPSPPQKIIDAFNAEFKDYDKHILRPMETNGLHKIKIYRYDDPSSVNGTSPPLVIRIPPNAVDVD